uniref:Calcyon neuron specific vesicular protein n=1 Tax=Pipistrellus kuhlii TaxID=59472 RepID=A0A7J7VAE4_PIPKU|nr:calcyon neuron specific vesicular protein [Pipistrellus kuhlii]
MVKLGFSFGKFGRDYGYQDGVTMDSVPLISPLDVSQLQPPYSDQVVIKTQTEYGLPPAEPMKKFPDLEAQKLASTNLDEGRGMPPARMLAFAMAIMGCLLIMYKALWYDQFSCPEGFLVRPHKMCTPMSLEMYYAEMGPERHRSILAAMGAYPLSRKPGTEAPLVWRKVHPMFKEGLKASAPAGPAATEAPTKPAAGTREEEEKEKEKEEEKEKEKEEEKEEKEKKEEKEEKEKKEEEKEEAAAPKAEGSAPPPALAPQ